MSQTLIISDQLHASLQAMAHKRGLNSVEQLLETLPKTDTQVIERKEAVRQIDAVREQLMAAYGAMPDSVDLLREDRAR